MPKYHPNLLKNQENHWNNILYRAGKITEKEAKKLRRRAKKFRKNFKFK